jgi:hypothetical protein
MMEHHLGHEVMQIAADIDRVGTGDDTVHSVGQLKISLRDLPSFQPTTSQCNLTQRESACLEFFRVFKIYHSSTLITPA